MKRSLLLLLVGVLGSLGSAGTLLAQSDTAAKVAAAAAQKTQSVTVLHLVSTGGMAMIPVGIMCIITLVLVIGYALTLRRGAIVTTHFMNTTEVLLKKRDYPGLLAIASRHTEAIARVVQRTLDFSSKNPTAPFEVVRDIAQTEGSTQAAALQHRITYLADIAVLSPMVGLLGTVFGIIHSFGVLASTTSQSSRPMLLAQGVSEALVATGAGLIVGIISMAFYGLFRNKVQSLISDLERAATQVLGLMSLNFETKRESRPEDRREDRRDDRERDRDRERERDRSPAPRRPAVSVDDEF